MEKPHITAVGDCSHITDKALFVGVVHRNIGIQYISKIILPKCYFQHGLEAVRKMLDEDFGSSQPCTFLGQFLLLP